MKHVLLAALLGCCACAGPASSPVAEPDPLGGPGEVVAELYDLITIRPGTPADWDAVRALFLEEALIVLRTGRDEMTVFTLEGWVDDFVQFIESANVMETGFDERILAMRETRFGDMAQVLVHFDSHVPGSERAPREGIDSFELIRRDGRWLIVAITNDRPRADRPIPGELFER